MKVNRLIEILQTCQEEKPIRFYLLENNELIGCKCETVLEVEGQVELTIEKIEDLPRPKNQTEIRKLKLPPY